MMDSCFPLHKLEMSLRILRVRHRKDYYSVLVCLKVGFFSVNLVLDSLHKSIFH